MIEKNLKIIGKNIFLRTLIFFLFLVIGNTAFFIRQETISPFFVWNFNLIAIALFLTINIVDFLIVKICRNSHSKFAEWLFVNKFFSWQTVRYAKYLSTTKQNKFLATRKSFFSVPLWSPFIQIPIGVIMIYTPLFVFSITTLLTTNFSLVISLAIFMFVIGSTLVMTNLWLKNCNDSYKFNSLTYNLIQNKIDKTNISDHNPRNNREIWTSGVLKMSVMIFGLILFTFSTLGFTIATKTLFTPSNLNINEYPYWQNWALFIFFVQSWKNALFIVIWSLLAFLWFVNLWVFIHAPWYLLMIWKKTYLSFNILTLNFIVISFWSVRFDDDEKMILPIKKANNPGKKITDNYEDTLATTSSIIEKKVENIKVKADEQIVTRVIPLDMIDEEK